MPNSMVSVCEYKLPGAPSHCSRRPLFAHRKLRWFEEISFSWTQKFVELEYVRASASRSSIGVQSPPPHGIMQHYHYNKLREYCDRSLLHETNRGTLSLSKLNDDALCIIYCMQLYVRSQKSAR